MSDSDEIHSGGDDLSNGRDEARSFWNRSSVATMVDTYRESLRREDKLNRTLAKTHMVLKQVEKEIEKTLANEEHLKTVFKHWGRVDKLNDICFPGTPTSAPESSVGSCSTQGNAEVVEISSDSGGDMENENASTRGLDLHRQIDRLEFIVFGIPPSKEYTHTYDKSWPIMSTQSKGKCICARS